MSAQALARKWRPQTFSTCIGQEHVIQGLEHALTQNRLHHAYLFTGTRGVGKTTLARIFAKCLNCEAGIQAEPCGKCNACVSIDHGSFLDLIEIDAASRTKVEDTRDLLDNVQYAPTSGRFKIYLIDEVHMLSTHSFNALLKTLEEPPEHVKFLLATTDPQKLPITVLSRCLQYHLRPLLPSQIQAQLTKIAKAEEITFEDDALKLIATGADGSVRDALSVLDQAIAYTENDLQTDKVRQMLGLVDEKLLYALADAIAQNDAPEGMKLVESIKHQAINFELLLSRLARFWQQCALLQVIPLEEAEFELDQLKAQSQKLSPAQVQLHYQICIKAQADLSLAPDAFCGFEMSVLRMLTFNCLPQKVQAQELTHTPIQTPTREPVQVQARAKVEQTPKSAPITPQRSVPQSAENAKWSSMVKQLEIVGMTKQLANHSVLDKIEGKKWYLHTEKAFENLLSERIVRKLEQSISEYVGSVVSLSIEVGQAQVQKTPAKQIEEKAQTQLKAAQDSIHADDHVQEIKDAFNAEVDGKTIKPIEINKE